MADGRTNTPSVVERTKSVETGAPVAAVHFLNDRAAFVLGEETILLASADGETQRVAVHGGAILSSAAALDRVITGGDDGAVMATNARGETLPLAQDSKKRWIDHVAAGPDGAVAWSAGKTAFVKPAKGDVRSLDVVSTVGGLAFAPKGFRLAIAHYQGVTLWFPNAAGSKPDTLMWKGSHHDVTFSPDGRFLVTAMQEPTLHGWRLDDRRDMRMSGYSARVRSLAWTAGTPWLASGGSNQLVLWPFQGKDGPMGKEPRLLAPHEARLVVVACHPKRTIAALGYADGMVLLARLDDGAEILARKPGDAAVSALAFSADGRLVAFGCEDGAAGLIDLA